MVRVDVTERFVKKARSLGAEATTRAQQQLTRLAAEFGNPHAHRGLGLRKIGRRSYEIRLWLRWRIVIIQEPDRLTAYDIMDHNEVVQWLKRRKGN
jgi:hypothetical protein